MVYQWKAGSRQPVEAQAAGERIAELTERNGGHLAPSDVVDDARPEDAVLHPAFEWDNEVAAEEYRKEQARKLIRSIEVIYEEGEQQQPVLNYVHVNLPDTGPAYVTTARAVSDRDLQRQVIEEALLGLRAWQKRYEHIGALDGLLTTVTRAIDEAEREMKRRRRANADTVRQAVR